METYRLAICEDDNAIRKEISALCQEILTEDGIRHVITEFSEAEELDRVLKEEGHPFDLLILDIQMNGMSGMELAKSLRQRGDRVSILFVTGYEDYLAEGYGVQPIHFLLKPISRKALAEALHTDWNLNCKPRTVTMHLGGRTISLILADIQYIESYNHNVVVHHQAGTSQTYLLSLTELERQLSSGQFCRCHNSYLVNMDYIIEIGRTELTLKNGIRIPIGRTYYKALQSTFIRYLNQ